MLRCRFELSALRRQVQQQERTAQQIRDLQEMNAQLQAQLQQVEPGIRNKVRGLRYACWQVGGYQGEGCLFSLSTESIYATFYTPFSGWPALLPICCPLSCPMACHTVGFAIAHSPATLLSLISRGFPFQARFGYLSARRLGVGMPHPHCYASMKHFSRSVYPERRTLVSCRYSVIAMKEQLSLITLLKFYRLTVRHEFTCPYGLWRSLVRPTMPGR